MFKQRKIIQIDEEKCNGCGKCTLVCAESALTIIDGKARLISDIYCDGLGACLGECPTGALKIIERKADEFDEGAVKKLQEVKEAKPQMACGCPSSQATVLKIDNTRPVNKPTTKIRSELRQWPIKLQLLSPRLPFSTGRLIAPGRLCRYSHA